MQINEIFGRSEAVLFEKKWYYAALPVWILGVLIALVNWHLHGIKTISDSLEFENVASDLIKGQFSDIHRGFYLGYIFVIAVLKNRYIIVIFQLLISLLSATVVFFTAKKYLKLKILAYLPAALLLLWPKVQVWNYFILSDSLFISCCVITVCAMLWWKPTDWRVILLVVISASIRPSGLIVFFGYLVSLGIFLNSRYRFTTLQQALGIVLAASFFLLMSNQVLTYFNITDTWQTGKVVYNVNNYPDRAIQNKLTLSTEELTIPVENEHPIIDMAQFVWLNPLFSIKLFGLKLGLFITDSRPYYSWLHIIVNQLLLLFCYSMTFISIVKASLLPYQRIFVSSILIGFTIMAGLTILSWEGRFFAPIYPIIFLFAVIGLDRFLAGKMALDVITT